MFDFDNTPINKNTFLQAQWQCGRKGLTYYGNWARITLLDGTTYEIDNETNFNSFCQASDPNGTYFGSIHPKDVAKVEFGTQVTYMPVISFRLEAFPNLSEINGFHEGLATINNYCFCTYQTANDPSTVPIKGALILPSTLTGQNHLAAGFLYRADRFVGDLVFNNPTGSVQTASTTCATTNPEAPFYTEGVAVYGRYAADWRSVLPNSNASGVYRNFWTASSEEDFIDCVNNGTAKYYYPAGTTFTSSVLSYEYTWMVAHYGEATLSNGSTTQGVYILCKQPLGKTGSYGYVMAADLANNWPEIDTIYKNGGSGPLKSLLTEISVPYWNGSNLTINATYFPPSEVEIALRAPAGRVEGQPWDYFWAASGNKYNENAVVARQLYSYGWWIRGGWSGANQAAYINSSGSANLGSSSTTTQGWIVATFIPLGGQ